MLRRFSTLFCSGLFVASFIATTKKPRVRSEFGQEKRFTEGTINYDTTNNHRHDQISIDQPSDISEFKPTELHPGFKSIFFYKLLNLDFHEMRRPEVLIELSLIGLPLIAGGITSYKLYSKTQFAWKYKHFYNTINITLNTITREHNYSHNYYHLRFRTLLEKQINEIIPNQKCMQSLVKAAKTLNKKNQNKNNMSNRSYLITTDSMDSHTYDIICNNLVNAISPLSAQTFLHNDILSLPNSVINENYIMVLTNEYSDDISYKNYFINNKIRVQLIKESVIVDLLKQRKISNKNQNSNRADNCKINWKYKVGTRYKVIEQILDIYETQMEQFGGIYYGRPLWPIELSTRADINEKNEYEKNGKYYPIAAQGRNSNTAKYYQLINIIENKQFSQLSQEEKRMTYREFKEDQEEKTIANGGEKQNLSLKL